MKKKEYMQPTIQVVKIQNHCQMLAVSSVQGYPGDYDPNGGDPNDAG